MIRLDDDDDQSPFAKHDLAGRGSGAASGRGMDGVGFSLDSLPPSDRSVKDFLPKAFPISASTGASNPSPGAPRDRSTVAAVGTISRHEKRTAPFREPSCRNGMGFCELRKGCRLGGLLPLAQRGLGHETGLDDARGDANALHLTVRENDLDALEVREEAALRDRGNVSTDTTLLLRFTGTPDVTALDGALAGDGTNTCHKIVPST